jgi:hypothetical protein
MSFCHARLPPAGLKGVSSEQPVPPHFTLKVRLGAKENIVLRAQLLLMERQFDYPN